MHTRAGHGWLAMVISFGVHVVTRALWSTGLLQHRNLRFAQVNWILYIDLPYTTYEYRWTASFAYHTFSLNALNPLHPHHALHLAPTPPPRIPICTMTSSGDTPISPRISAIHCAQTIQITKRTCPLPPSRLGRDKEPNAHPH
jgi:hypothetical protein